MAGRTELPKRTRKPTRKHGIPPNVRAFAEHLAADPVAPLRRGLACFRAVHGRPARRRDFPEREATQ
jgi:hypothetical protein